jgi:cytochrome P450
MGLTKVLLAIVFLSIAYPCYSTFRNYLIARRVGLPIIISPVHPFNPLWWIIGPPLFPLMKRSPFQTIRDWALFGDIAWPFGDRGHVHQRLGTAFLVVTPGGTTLITDDPKATETCLRRINDFIKPPIMYSAIEFYGKNVDTVNGDAWQRHRRLTTPPFNERNSGLVWEESLKQADGMIKHWNVEETVTGMDTSRDTLKLALHVLTSAGFGKTYDFDVGTTKVPEGHKLSYRDALAGILKNMLLAIIMARVNGPMWLLPKSWQNMKLFQTEFKQYMVEMADEQREAMKKNAKDMQSDNLMGALIRANEVSRAEGKERYALTDDEIYGNLFIWNLAGHDTTATTLAYAFTLLSAHEGVQEWIGEEIYNVFGSAPPDEWDYDAAFPQLKRCLATMV